MSTSSAARALAALGAEVVEGDLDRPETIADAFRGAYGAYCVTFFWEHFSPEKELAQARMLAQLARAEQLQHVIWSTLEDTRRCVPLDDDRMPTLMGAYKVPHFDAKGEAQRAFYLNAPTTFLRTSFYWDNFIHFGLGPKPDENGRLVLNLPMGDKLLPGIAAEDIGKCAYGVFRTGLPLIGRVVGIAGGHPSGEEMAAALSAALGEDVAYRPLTPDGYRRLGFPGAQDLGKMFQFKRDFNEHYCRSRDIGFSHYLNPELQDLPPGRSAMRRNCGRRSGRWPSPPERPASTRAGGPAARRRTVRRTGRPVRTARRRRCPCRRSAGSG